MEERLEKLLLSDLDDDVAVGWELVEAKKIPHTEVMEFVSKNMTNMAVDKDRGYYWDGYKFKLWRRQIIYGNSISGSWGGTVSAGYGPWGGSSTSMIQIQQPGRILSVSSAGITHTIKLEQSAIQEEKRVGIARKVCQNIKAFIKRLRRRLLNW